MKVIFSETLHRGKNVYTLHKNWFGDVSRLPIRMFRMVDSKTEERFFESIGGFFFRFFFNHCFVCRAVFPLVFFVFSPLVDSANCFLFSSIMLFKYFLSWLVTRIHMLITNWVISTYPILQRSTVWTLTPSWTLWPRSSTSVLSRPASTRTWHWRSRTGRSIRLYKAPV